MIVHCSKKLESFIGNINAETALNQENGNKWNGHLISIDSRKCLFFTHKKTLYSVLLIDILKKDLEKLDELFFETFLNYLKSDNIYKPEWEKYLSDHFGSLKLLPTDNDQRTLATLRDNTERLKLYCSDKKDKLPAAEDFARTKMNGTPLGARDFKFPRELMKEELENYA